MLDTFAPLVTSLTHSGFKEARPVSRKQWAPLLHHALESPSDLAARIAASPEPMVRDSLLSLDAISNALQDLQDLQVFALTLFDSRYPNRWIEKLPGKLPPVIFGLGDPNLLNHKSIAILGSRDAPEASLTFAQNLAEAAIDKGFVVTTGGARGVDLVATRTACQSGGQAIVFAADRLTTLQKNLIRSGCDPDRLVIVTPSHPDSPFTVGQAMGRNKLVYALSEVTLIASCEEGSGGTWTGAIEALKGGWCPVGVWTGAGAPDGNQALAKSGAQPVLSPEDFFALEGKVEQAGLF